MLMTLRERVWIWKHNERLYISRAGVAEKSSHLQLTDNFYDIRSSVGELERDLGALLTAV